MDRICKIPDCGGDYFAKDWCKTHYNRNYHYGDPLFIPQGSSYRQRSTKCKVPDCGPDDKIIRGYCRKHYARWKAHGPDGVVNLPPRKRDARWDRNPLERFYESVEKSAEENGCWNWQGKKTHQKSTTRGRYGLFRIGPVSEQVSPALAHRFSYEAHNNITLTTAEPVHHKCANTLCVNPDHLQVITPEENTAEMFERHSYMKRIAELESELQRLTELTAS